MMSIDDATRLANEIFAAYPPGWNLRKVFESNEYFVFTYTDDPVKDAIPTVLVDRKRRTAGSVAYQQLVPLLYPTGGAK